MAKRNKDWDELVRRGKAESLLKTPQQFAGRGAPPAPGSPDSTRFYNESKMLQEMANDPNNANRLAQNKQLILQGLAEESNKTAKKNALKEMLAKFKGKGGRGGGPLGGGLMGRQIR